MSPVSETLNTFQGLTLKYEWRARDHQTFEENYSNEIRQSKQVQKRKLKETETEGRVEESLKKNSYNIHRDKIRFLHSWWEKLNAITKDIQEQRRVLANRNILTEKESEELDDKVEKIL